MTLNVDGKNLTLDFALKYNEMAGYWIMTVSDPVSGNIYLDSIPLLTGDYPAANILEQYAYLNIGSAYILNVGNASSDSPDDTNLGTDFLLVWGDTP